MHYIVGTTILVQEQVQRQQTGPVSVTDMKRNSTRKVENTTPFQTGVEYSLYNIRPDKNLLEYKFYSQTTGHTVDLTFSSASEGDNYIAKLRGEALPDYSEINRRRSD